ncbi:hypothetical protein LTR91_000948 [Friedmanniomyces endolithicus]|uniref:Uncharacterized protein n=1 Tax=Friedmanniomyces endolithicus TaxID=329885 RepID=A0AAN6L235_9PEZI|nr:hypothetical protein LTR94_007196 [Friedmanniomyces endolithicus]KAK0794425.1 hypothetical protein LTR59_007844 [Friedmanniomyces endolithicus]KAK0807259.1 hypothetical protein LTR75_006643 [Friedmanniomyces endolithicus]KAK0845584.1 hypothetical protein LTR03_007332 [Friedmanniomyces endolithicus]KAK0899283.1 hypothetical protein LTR57_021184 [Friedmanniomyces endolithicus]
MFLALSVLSAATKLDPDIDTRDIATWNTQQSDEAIIDTSRLADYPVPSAVQHSFDIINSMQGPPSCHRMAADALLDSCATLKAPASPHGLDMTATIDPLLNAEQSLYAARMTACDFERDQLPLPDACSMFLPTQRTTRKRVLKGWFGSAGPSEPTSSYPDYEALTTVNLPSCIKALYSDDKAQGWTAYIHNFHGAKVTCNAMRTDIDKDEQINLMRVLLKTTSDVDSVLAGSKQEMAKMAQQITEVQVSARKYIVQLHEAQADYREVIARYMADLQALTDQSLENIITGFQRVEVEADLTVDAVKGGHREMQDSLSRTQSGLIELTVAQRQQWQVALTQGTATIDDIVAYAWERVTQSAEQEVGRALQHMQQTFSAGINEMRMSIRNQTDQIHQDLDEAREKARLLNGDWSGLFGWSRSAISFVGYLFVYTLFNYAIWQSLSSFSVSGNVCVSLGCGIVLAKTSIAFGDPIDVVKIIASRSPDWLIIACIYSGGMLALGVVFKRIASWRLPLSSRQRAGAEESWTVERGLKSPRSDTPAYFHRLPINDPRYMAEKQASFRKWHV